MDYTRIRIERARAAHEAQARAERLAELQAAGKPGPAQVMSYEDAELLAQTFEYADGEPIGLMAVAGTDDVQRLCVADGQVVAEGSHALITLPRYDVHKIFPDPSARTVQSKAS